MATLTELIKRDGVEAHWFWTHEVSTGPYSEYEVWDLVLVRNTHEPELWVTGGDTRRTAYFKGIGGSRADSRRETGGERREPDLTEALADLLSDALRLDEMPRLGQWIQESVDSGSYDPKCMDRYDTAVRVRETLRDWLGDEYDEYVHAAYEV